jgi:hypothetical protein
MSKTYILIKKTGDIIEKAGKYEVEKFYKYAGFRSTKDFELQHTFENGWQLYGKNTGRANQENKYEFPPPIDNTLFYGTLLIISKKDDILKSDWEEYYEKLFGGFEDIDDDDDDDDDDDTVQCLEDEDDDDEDYKTYTKNGYEKDGFVVSDEDAITSYSSDEESEYVLDDELEEEEYL